MPFECGYFCAQMYCKCCTQMIFYYSEVLLMNKTISMSIRVSEEELEKLKQAARLEAYASYSEFIRRTALIEADKVIEEKGKNQEGK